MHNKLLTFSLVIICCLSSSIEAEAQTVQKSYFSGFSNVSANDSIYVASGQIMAGESLNPRILHGYFPLQYSLLNIEAEVLNSISIYPNPANDFCTIDFGDFGEYTITIIDIQSQIIRSESCKNSSTVLNLSELSRGLYFIVIYQDEKLIFNKKLIKY